LATELGPILSLLHSVHAELMLIVRLLNAACAQLLTLEAAVARELRAATVLMHRAPRLHGETLVPPATRHGKMLCSSTVLSVRCKVRRALHARTRETVAAAAVSLGLETRATAAMETLEARRCATAAMEALEMRRAATAATRRLELAASVTATAVRSLRLTATMAATAAMVSRLRCSRGRNRQGGDACG
jgi:hypothetical protein